jgi:hypothetical protein
MALAELAAKRAADSRRKTKQQKEVVAELRRNTMLDVDESQQQSESPEASRKSNLADPDTPGRTAQVTKNLQEVANYNEHNYGFEYSSSNSEENELEFEDESPAAARKPAAIAKKPPEVPNVNDDEESSANDSEALAKKPPAVPKKKPAAIATSHLQSEMLMMMKGLLPMMISHLFNLLERKAVCKSKVKELKRISLAERESSLDNK